MEKPHFNTSSCHVSFHRILGTRTYSKSDFLTYLVEEHATSPSSPAASFASRLSHHDLACFLFLAHLARLRLAPPPLRAACATVLGRDFICPGGCYDLRLPHAASLLPILNGLLTDGLCRAVPLAALDFLLPLEQRARDHLLASPALAALFDPLPHWTPASPLALPPPASLVLPRLSEMINPYRFRRLPPTSSPSSSPPRPPLPLTAPRRPGNPVQAHPL